EGLLEAVVEAEREGLLAGFVAGQGQQDRPLVVRALAQVLRNLPGLDAAEGHIDDDAIGMEALGPDPGLEARGRGLDTEVVALPEMFAEHGLERGVGPDDEDLVVDLGLEIPQGHPMLLEEPQEVFPRDPAILGAGDSIATQTARVEPLADGPGRDLADLRDLA